MSITVTLFVFAVDSLNGLWYFEWYYRIQISL